MNRIRSSSELKSIVREQLLGNYKTVILSCVIMQLIVSGLLSMVNLQTNSNSIISLMIYWAVYILVTLLTAVFQVGQFRLYRKLLAQEEITLSDMWYGFSWHPDKALVIQFLLMVIDLVCSIPFFIMSSLYSSHQEAVLFLFAALSFIVYMVAIVIVNLMLSQSLYLLMDYPEESATTLLKHSARMMKGHKGKLFYLNMSFLGIMVLCLCSFGIGILWAYPYMVGTRTLFYEELLKNEPHIDVTIAD